MADARRAEGPGVIPALLLYGPVLGVAGLLLHTAWLSDDAYITLRVVDNLWAGYGLRWNVLERVQVFTHPLWMLLLAGAYGFTREAFWTTIAVSMSLSAGVLLLLARQVARGTAAAVAALALVAASKSVVEFSTSGLENPLSHALLIAFLVALWRAREEPAALDRAAFLAGLCGLCRLDLLVLAGPPLVAALWRARAAAPPRLLRRAALAAAPVLLWWAFAFVYFGSIWPNTALAKLPPNVGLADRVPQGLRYLADVAIVDPVTALVLVAAIARAWWRDADRPLAVALSAGLAYVVAIGGDFMTGRFLSAPAVVAIAVLARHVAWNRRRALPFAAAVLALGLAMPQSPLRVWRQPQAGDPLITHGAGIADERAFYAPYTGTIAVWRGSHPRQHPWAQGGRTIREQSPTVFTYESVGLLGYYAGPGVHIVDSMALTDPLLARRPANEPWRIGHFQRFLPRGYVERLQACVARAFPAGAKFPVGTCVDAPAGVRPMDPDAAAIYARVSALAQLPLLDPKRTALLWQGGLDW